MGAAGAEGAGTGVLAVGLYALATALATGLGALPFLLFRKPPRRWLGLANAVAAGLMLAASFQLFYEALEFGVWRMLLGVALGLVFITLSHGYLEGRETLKVGRLEGADALKGLMMVGVMTVHSVTEGVGVGVSFGGGAELGLFITLAIAAHNVPEGLAISLILVPRGESVARAAGWSVFSSLPQPLLAVPAYLFVEAFRPALPVGLGFAGGAMVWMVFSELMPEALEDADHVSVGVTVTVSLVLMIAAQMWLRG